MLKSDSPIVVVDSPVFKDIVNMKGDRRTLTSWMVKRLMKVSKEFENM